MHCLIPQVESDRRSAPRIRGSHASFRPPVSAPPSRGARSPAVIDTPRRRRQTATVSTRASRADRAGSTWSSCPVPKAKTVPDVIERPWGGQAKSETQVIVSAETIGAVQHGAPTGFRPKRLCGAVSNRENLLPRCVSTATCVGKFFARGMTSSLPIGGGSAELVTPGSARVIRHSLASSMPRHRSGPPTSCHPRRTSELRSKRSIPFLSAYAHRCVLLWTNPRRNTSMKSASIAAGYLLALVSGSASSGAPPVMKPISMGSGHGCTSVFPEKLFCWGTNYFNQVGAGPVGSGFVAPKPIVEMVGLQDYSAGQSTSCALRDDQVFCWGLDVPADHYSDAHGVTPIAAYPPGSGVTDVEVGAEVCVVRDGDVECWSVDQENYNPLPHKVVGLTSAAASISVGPAAYVSNLLRQHACAVSNSKGFCWGTNAAGELGSGNNVDTASAVEVVNLGVGVTDIAAGLMHSCAIVNGGVKCWGDNQFGQLGVAAPVSSTSAVAVSVLTDGVSAITAGAHHTCAIQYGSVYCWGLNLSQQLGDGTTQNRFSPTPAMTVPFSATAIDAGNSSTCATNHSDFIKPGRIRCWGGPLPEQIFEAFPHIWSSGFEAAGGRYAN